MRSRSLVALVVGLGSCLALFAGLDTRRAPEDPPNPPVRKSDATTPRVLPGLLADGSVQLPNQWKLRPAGRQLEVGNFPVNLAVHPSGQYLAVLHAGWQEHEVMIVDLNKAKQKVVSRVTVDQTFYGLCFSPDGRRLYASGGRVRGRPRVRLRPRAALGKPRAISLAREPARRLVVGGLAIGRRRPRPVRLLHRGATSSSACRSRTRTTRRSSTSAGPKAAEEGAGRRASRPARRTAAKTQGRRPARRTKPKTGPGDRGRPPVRLPARPGRQAAVRQPVGATPRVAVIDLEKNEVVGDLADRRHPTEMVLSPDGKALFVACANSTQVSVLDPATGERAADDQLRALPDGPERQHAEQPAPDARTARCCSSPTRTPTTSRVFNVADPARPSRSGSSRPAGTRPRVRSTRPTRRSTSPTARALTSQAEPRRAEPDPAAAATLDEYIGGLFKGTLGIIDMPTPEADGRRTRKQAYACSPLRRTTPARGRRRRGRQPDPAQGRRPVARSSTALHHQGEPHLRPGLRRHEARATASRSSACSPSRSRRTTTSWRASSSCSTTSTWTARCRPTATSGRWGPTPPTSSSRSGR